MFKATPHPILVTPTAAQAVAMGTEKWLEFMGRREERIRQEREEPLLYGYEPPIWGIKSALLDLPWFRTPEWRAEIRAALGFRERVRVLLVLGGNRGGKSEFGAKTQTRVLNARPERITWTFHATSEMSIDTHHKLFWKYMPRDLRHMVRGEIAYIAYKQKTGFADHKFVLPNRSEGTFKHYSMEKDDALQGPEIDSFWADELAPPDWVEDLEMRIATREGFGLVTFTPVQGYSATVKLFQDGAVPALESIAFLLPKDGGEPDVARALGFQSQEEMDHAHEQGRWSIPSKFELRDGRLVELQPPVPAGRVFQTVPRVMRCVNPNYAIAFVHTSDNPYGNPKSVVETLRKKSEMFVKERYYGIATKTMSCRFAKFTRSVHVLPAKAIPAVGTNYMFLDPASGRNFFMKWYRRTKEGVYLYREWPSRYEIPGMGVPGLWALPDGKRPDGRPGPGQNSFGFGLLRYKQEIARLEGWTDAIRGKRKPAGPEKDPLPDPGPIGLGHTEQTMEERGVKEWSADRGAREVIFERYIDSRAASSPRVENDRPKTLLTDFQDIGIDFLLTPGDEIDEGVAMINDALDYDDTRPIDFFNKPKFYVSEECVNSIFALETWTGADGNKGATKDPIDLDRYLFQLDLEMVDADYWKTTGGQ